MGVSLAAEGEKDTFTVILNAVPNLARSGSWLSKFLLGIPSSSPDKTLRNRIQLLLKPHRTLSQSKRDS